MHLLAEGGLIGLGLGLGALLAIARLGRRALAAAPPPPRALVLGAIFGGLALAIQCLADFPLHIPAIGVVAVILCAHLCRLGLDARRVGRPPDQAPTRLDRAGAVLIGLVMIAASLAALRQSAVLAEVERQITAAGLPLPDTKKPQAVEPLLPRPELERRRDVLVRVMRSRPDWAEGYLRLGNTYLGLYNHMASEWIGDAPADHAHPDVRTDPLWLHGVLHSTTPERLAEFGGPLEHEPVRLFLAPAARCFLEARRCCPVQALPHARLASLDFLLPRGESGSVHAERAARLAGGDSQVLAMTAQVAFQLHDLDLAARCWKSYFAARDKDWGGIAVAAAVALAPEKILDVVLPAGTAHAVQFADDLGTTPKVRQYREPLLKAALARLPRDPGLSPLERLWVEAQLRARLDERDRARTQMREALEREPNRESWREESVRWLLQWGDFREAYHQALIGTQLNPDHPDLRRAMEVAVQAMKRPTPNQGGAND